MTPSYYLVWNPDTGYTKFRHYNLYVATEEAKRLARQHPGSEFVVLQAVRSVKVNDILIEEYDTREELPF